MSTRIDCGNGVPINPNFIAPQSFQYLEHIRLYRGIMTPAGARH